MFVSLRSGMPQMSSALRSVTAGAIMTSLDRWSISSVWTPMPRPLIRQVQVMDQRHSHRAILPAIDIFCFKIKRTFLANWRVSLITGVGAPLHLDFCVSCLSDFGLITLIIYVDVTDVLGPFKCPHDRTHFPTSHQANKPSNQQSEITS